MIEKECIICKTFFKTFPSVNSKTCSKKCGIVLSAKTRTGTFRKKHIKKICEYCSKEFTVFPWRKNARFCSKRCTGLGTTKTMEKSPYWKGGKYISNNGYVKIYKTKGKYVLEHRSKMEDIIGRPLKRSEDVHHINGDKTDNRISNLQLISNTEHGYLTFIQAKRCLQPRPSANGKLCQRFKPCPYHPSTRHA